MTLCRICEHAATDTSTGVCRDCMNAYVSRLQWLRLIGMPTLRQVAYRQVDLGEHAARLCVGQYAVPSASTCQPSCSASMSAWLQDAAATAI